MSLKLQALAFLKERKVKYYIVCDQILFSCFYCGEKAEMNAATTSWHCKCGKSGNLGNLIKFNEEEIKSPTLEQFINPKKEKYDINYLLNTLREKNNEDTGTLKMIQNKFNKLCKEFDI